MYHLQISNKNTFITKRIILYYILYHGLCFILLFPCKHYQFLKASNFISDHCITKFPQFLTSDNSQQEGLLGIFSITALAVLRRQLLQDDGSARFLLF
jgi:hypothetical protein